MYIDAKTNLEDILWTKCPYPPCFDTFYLISWFTQKREDKWMLYAASMGGIWLSRVVTNAKSKNGEDNTKTSPTTAKV